MFLNILMSIFGSKNDRILKRYNSTLRCINALENDLLGLSDLELKKKFFYFKNNYENMDFFFDVLPNVYSIVREVSFRVLEMRHYDVQILGGIALYDNKIIEVVTGEGKTLVATLPVCLFHLRKRPVHVVTVNDYLARRDAVWMGPVYDFLDLTVGVLNAGMSFQDRKNAYKADVVYGTCSEFGFDYLRDNIVLTKHDKVQSKLHYAIIDEVDSILIDEARTPLIISLPDKVNSKLYLSINKIAKELVNVDDFVLDEKNKHVQLTEHGFLKLESLFRKYCLLKDKDVLYDIGNINLLHDIYASLKALYLFRIDIDYIVKDNSVLIIDEHTGRVMDGRRWGDGIHQALEAKENIDIRSENQLLASITFQNYFRLYEVLSGMTGTAYTEYDEFLSIYGLEVVIIPTNKPCIRNDLPDLVFFDKQLKFTSIVDDIKRCYNIGQPILVGSTSIEVSEFLSDILRKNGIKHNVLNAKNHEKESQIIAEAGKLKSVTIATNMAGRGTDIVLGGRKSFLNEYSAEYHDIVKLGGLRVIGTERHESRRIDNQLRGRCGRQGDPGCSQFYLSLEDDLIRIFIGDKIFILLNKLKISSNDVISNKLVNKSIENAQRRVESHNFDIRKQLLEFDDIFNEQRVVFYSYRDFFIFNDDIISIVETIFSDVVDLFFSTFVLNTGIDIIVDYSEILKFLVADFGINVNLDGMVNLDISGFKKKVCSELHDSYFKKRALINVHVVSDFEKIMFLNILDIKWREHLLSLDYLKKGIHLRGYAQQDPKQEYKKESFLMFENMLISAKYEFVVLFLRVSVDDINNNSHIDFSVNIDKMKFNHNNDIVLDKNKTYKRDLKIGRNSLCYCNSGKKYKQCHGYG